jgi:hypothetical protein
MGCGSNVLRIDYFFWILYNPISSDQGIESRFRSAIAGGIVAQYLILVATVAFFDRGPSELPQITQNLISNFTAVVGIVIAFYFGSSAYIIGKRPNKEE